METLDAMPVPGRAIAPSTPCPHNSGGATAGKCNAQPPETRSKQAHFPQIPAGDPSILGDSNADCANPAPVPQPSVVAQILARAAHKYAMATAAFTPFLTPDGLWLQPWQTKGTVKHAFAVLPQAPRAATAPIAQTEKGIPHPSNRLVSHRSGTWPRVQHSTGQASQWGTETGGHANDHLRQAMLPASPANLSGRGSRRRMLATRSNEVLSEQSVLVLKNQIVEAPKAGEFQIARRDLHGIARTELGLRFDATLSASATG